jgi:hypothetical protein
VITYELSKKHLRDHLQFMSTTFPSSSGSAHRALLSCLGEFFRQLSEPHLNDSPEFTFLHFAARIANDADRKPITELLICVSQAKFEALWQLMIRWTKAGGDKFRFELLLLTVRVRACPDTVVNIVDTLQQLVDAHSSQRNARLRVAV